MGKHSYLYTLEIQEAPLKTLAAYKRELRSLVEDHRVLTRRLLDLIELLEDEDDHRTIELAKKRNGSKPGIPWSEAKKRLGLAD